MKRPLLVVFLLIASMQLRAQYAWQLDAEPGKANLGHGLEYSLEAQGTASSEQTPLWLNANKYGLSSLESTNGYVRGSLIRPLTTDSARRWGFGYGVDAAVAGKFTSTVVLQQAFVQMRWLHGVLTVGEKQQPMNMKNQRLSSGSQTLGINARPIPQVRLEVPKYWVVPLTRNWLRFRGHLAYGLTTDDNWQKDFTSQKTKYTQNTLYHSKSGFLMIGNPDRFFPVSLEMGLEMACIFGGTSYIPKTDGTMREIQNNTDIKSYWRAFVPAGSDVTDGDYGNIEGNQLGSWMLRLNYDADTWAFHVYADHYFEDHSQMFFIDYDGYRTGEGWEKKHRWHAFMYDIKDMMLGAEVNLKYGSWLRNVVFEYIYTKYQSGPIYHDHTKNIADHIAGADNYYNHSLYTGWQHWGQVMGNPLFRSPIYNNDGKIEVENNRFIAFHLGVDGGIGSRLDYRLLATYQDGLGSYQDPYLKKHHNVSLLCEAAYRFNHGWKAQLGVGADFGKIRGNTQGVQLTISKSGIFNL